MRTLLLGLVIGLFGIAKGNVMDFDFSNPQQGFVQVSNTTTSYLDSGGIQTENFMEITQ